MSTRARLQPSVMPPAVLYLKNRLAAADRRYAGRFALLAAIHLAAFGMLLWSEDEPAARAAFVLTWGNMPKAADRKSTRLNSSHLGISYAVFCLKKKKNKKHDITNTYNK